MDVLTKNRITHALSDRWDASLGFPHTAIYNEIRKYDENKIFMSEKEWNSFDSFFRTATTNEDSLFFIEYNDIVPSAKDASDIIRKAGEMVFLAHAYQYGLNNHIEFVDNMLADKIIDGVEVYHSTFTAGQSEEIIRYCHQRDLPMSGGSDSHGHKGKIREIGTGYGNLDIPTHLIEKWIDKLI